MIRTIPVICFLALLLSSCGSKPKKVLSGDAVSSIQELMESFDELRLPYAFTDTLLRRREPNDSSLISHENFSKFFSDTIYKREMGSSSKGVRIYSIGKVSVKDNETYLFIKVTKGEKRAGYVLCVDEKGKFKVSIPLIKDDEDRATVLSALMDKKYTITVSRERLIGEDVFYTNHSYYYTTAGEFMLAAIDTNEKPSEEKLVNPIDTLPRKMKYCGDYILNKLNIVSVRDGRNEKERTVFISLNKNDGDCSGEVKGTMARVKDDTFRFSAPGDPCSIDLVFSARGVSISEVSGCGNHRGMSCSYSGHYILKKEPKPSDKKTSSKRTNK